MCIQCCPVKNFTTGKEGELWKNYCGSALGKLLQYVISTQQFER